MSLRIALLEPFFGGSHERWARELQSRSSHEIDLYSLPARHWKWRMHGGAISLAERILSQEKDYNLFLATDMLDLSLFLSLVRHRFPRTPAALYFHENQLSYPWSPRDQDPAQQRDLHYAFINYTSALCSDATYFNSRYNQNSFLEELEKLLARYPDHKNKSTLSQIAQKSCVLPLGLDLKELAQHQPTKTQPPSEIPLLLWNHRWEYDKNPEDFVRMLDALLDRGIEFEVALLGERFSEEPAYFARARERLGRRVLAYGKVESLSHYAQWLWRSHILPVTSRQDFFGGSIVEAISCGCHPILPNRLAYPEHIDAISHPEVFYESLADGIEALAELIGSERWKEPFPLAQEIQRYDWKELISNYDDAFEQCGRDPR